jgi:hypothetical protein
MKEKLPAMGDPIGVGYEIISILYPMLDIVIGDRHNPPIPFGKVGRFHRKFFSKVF